MPDYRSGRLAMREPAITLAAFWAIEKYPSRKVIRELYEPMLNSSWNEEHFTGLKRLLALIADEETRT